MQIIPTSEVLASYGVEREEWLAAMWAELNSLRSKRVFGDVLGQERNNIRAWEILPMKVVLGIKSADQTGYKKKKVRAVVCGNHQAPNPDEQLYTANVDISTVRLMLAEAASKEWSLGSLDVNTAFLNADLPPDSQNVYVKPPSIMEKLGLVERHSLEGTPCNLRPPHISTGVVSGKGSAIERAPF